MADLWDEEDRYWRQNYAGRRYAKDSDSDTLAPGYRYGSESATRCRGCSWNDVESDLERDWNSYSHREKCTVDSWATFPPFCRLCRAVSRPATRKGTLRTANASS
jgi:hypothetical protein